MAIDLYSDTTTNMTTSPRISFSYDLSQNDTVPVEQLLRSISSSSVDFNFSVQQNSDLPHASMADELFYNGKMLPTEVRSKTTSLLSHPPRPKHEHSRSPAVTSLELEDEFNIKQNNNNNNNNTKSFWRFKRSSSCGNGYARSLCPIALLSRSHSTGSSSTSSKRSSCSKEVNRSFQKPVSVPVSQKPPLRKSGYGYGTGTWNEIRVNPVLNLGFGSFFNSNSKNKIKK